MTPGVDKTNVTGGHTKQRSRLGSGGDGEDGNDGDDGGDDSKGDRQIEPGHKQQQQQQGRRSGATEEEPAAIDSKLSTIACLSTPRDRRKRQKEQRAHDREHHEE